MQYILLAVTSWKESVGSAQVLQMDKLVSLQYLPLCCLKFLDTPVQKCQFPDAEVMASQSTSVKQYHDNSIGLPSSPQNGKNFHATLLQNPFATERKTLGPQHMKNTLECQDFWMEVIEPVLLGRDSFQ